MEEVGGKRGRNRETGAGGGKHVSRDGFLGIMKLGSGNKFKIMTILVDPLGEKDLKITGLNRLVEARIIKYFKKRGLFERGKYYG